MKSKRQHVHTHIFAALSLILTLLLVAPGVTPAAMAGGVSAVQKTTRVDQSNAETFAAAGLTAGDQATILDLVREAEYQFAWQVSDGEWAYRAPNRAHGLSLSLAADGFHAARYSEEGERLWNMALSLAAYGGQTFPAAIGEDDLIGGRERVEYHWSRDVVEWYVNRAAGIEHGLTLAAPPAGSDGSRVELTFALRGSLAPELDAGGGALSLKDASGETVLVYDQLAVYDATGRSLPAYFSLSPGGEGHRLQFTIDAAGAAYPLTVDPVLHSQQVKLIADDAEGDDHFGSSVSVSGDIIVVGAPQEDGGVANSDRGAAYVFERNKDGADSWGQVQKLTPSVVQDYANFGSAVAISGGRLVVAAHREDAVGGGSCAVDQNCGAVYLFERNEGGPDNWGQVKKLVASDADEADAFGTSVAISGDTVVVGAPSEDGAPGHTDRGAAYVFERNHKPGTPQAENWGQVDKLISESPVDGDSFGASVAISGDTIAVGAPRRDGAGLDEGAVSIFARNEPTIWGRVTSLVSPNPIQGGVFGDSVAISGDTMVVGAKKAHGNHGAAYLFERNQGGADGWGEVTELSPSGSEYLFNFGGSVAISGDTVVVGEALNHGTGTNQGAAYLFERNQGGADNWGQAARLTASDPQDLAQFGHSVAISGDTLVIGADGEGETGAIKRGAAYLYAGMDGQWQEVAIPHAAVPAAGDRYGISVALSGDTAIVGADSHGSGDANDRGAAYIIERNRDGADKWGEVTKLAVPYVTQKETYFGYSVAISGDTAVVGAWKEDRGGTDRGAAYVFERNDNPSSSANPIAENWGQVAQLDAASDGPDRDNDNFGFSVAISGDTIVVGAWGEQGASGTDRGAAYIFTRNEGGTDNWGQAAKLLASDEESSDCFGYSVAISGDTVVAGAHGENGGGWDRGKAYVFERNYDPNNPATPLADNWGEVQMLAASDAEDYDHFGRAVAISGDTVVVGADGEDGPLVGGDNRGAAYVFERNHDWTNPGTPLADNWGQVKKLKASTAANDDQFGRSVAISGDTIVIGAWQANGAGFNPDDHGRAYVFERNYNPLSRATPLADNWGEVTKLAASDEGDDDFFGHSVAISGKTIVVGAHGNNDDGSNSGSAYVFRLMPLREITVSPGSLDFGNWGVDAGPSPSQVVTISNDGLNDLQVSGVSLVGGDAAEFAIASDSGETTLGPGGTRTVQVSFDPSNNSSMFATLSIESDDANEPTIPVTLGGAGQHWPEITVSPGSLAFGNWGVDAPQALSKVVSIKNDGSVDLHISSVSLTGADAAAFAIGTDSGEATLTPGSTRQVGVSFDPSSTGAKSANLSIVSDDYDESTVDVTLSGTGVSGSGMWRVLLPMVRNNN